MGNEPDMGSGTLVDVLVARADTTPDQLVYTYLSELGAAGETLTYGELYARATGLAGRIAAVGRPGDRVLIPSTFGAPFVSGFFGCLLAGRIPVPVARPRGAAGMAALAVLAVDCAATVLLSPMALRAAGLTWLDSSEPGEPIAEPVRPGADDIAFLQYTSGSTRSPRGVVVTHANLMHNLDAIARAFGTEPDHRGVFWLPPHHDMGLVGGLLAAIHTGCPVTLMSPTAFLRDPLVWLRAIAADGRTVSGGPNFCYDHAVRKVAPADVATLDLSRWDVAFVGAEAVNPAVLGRFAEHFAPAGFRASSFLPCYGLAEATLLVAASRKGAGVRTVTGVVSCGESTSVAVVGADGQRVPAGETGEIWVTGPSVARGYWRGGADVFGATLPGESGTYVRTGDLGFERDGELHVAGRVKELVVVRGRNIVPQDIEWSVEAHHPEVRTGGCAAVGVTVAGEERLAVLVEAARRTADLETSVRQLIERDHGIDVHRVVTLRPGQLPRTTSGKVQRGKAATLAADSDSDTVDVAQRLFDGLTAAELAADLDTTPAPVEPVHPVPVRLSLYCFARDTGKHALFLECARFADRNGFDAIWVPERRFPRYGGPFPNPAVLGAALATTTTRLRIRAAAIAHDPVSTAQEWSVVDNLAHSRVDLVFAAEDQRPVGIGHVRQLWRGTPWVLCQGNAERFTEAGEAGANVLTVLLLQDLGKLRAKIDAYRQARAANGHDPGHVTLLARVPANRLRAAEQFGKLADAGVDEIACLVDLARPRDEVHAELRHLAGFVPADLSAGVRDRLTRRTGGGVFEQARDFDLAHQLSEAGLMPFYPDLTDSDGATVDHHGRRLIMLGANNYLGLTADKRVREATAAAALAEGPSVSGSRLLNGSTPAQRDLERALARFVGRPDALVFTTGYQANLGLLSAFLGEGTMLVADEECHAAAHDGVAIGGGQFVPFRHNDVVDLDRRLSSREGAPAMVMVDGVYSMSGDLAPLAEIREVCDRHGVPLAVDDAHGLGMAGRHGRGVEDELGVPGCADMLTGTFSKSLASTGGWVAGPTELVDWVRYHARPMLFSAAISPPAVAAAAASLEILAAEPERVARLRGLADRWRAGLTALGFDTGTSRTAIVPVHLGDELTALRFVKGLVDAGVYANCVLAPAVPPNRAMIRTTVSAAHETHHLDTALAAFAAVGRELGVLPH